MRQIAFFLSDIAISIRFRRCRIAYKGKFICFLYLNYNVFTHGRVKKFTNTFDNTSLMWSCMTALTECCMPRPARWICAALRTASFTMNIWWRWVRLTVSCRRPYRVFARLWRDLLPWSGEWPLSIRLTGWWRCLLFFPFLAILCFTVC